MKIDCRILSAYGFFDPKILELPKDALEGAVFTAPFFDPDAQDTVIKMYNKSYQSVYDEIPDIWSAQSYDAANLILSVLSKGDRSGPQIQTGLANIKNYPGVSGLTSFDKNGEVVKPLRIMTVKEGKFINYSLSAQ
jgi:branched-chain amino acid transport system substrate-binding protein